MVKDPRPIITFSRGTPDVPTFPSKEDVPEVKSVRFWPFAETPVIGPEKVMAPVFASTSILFCNKFAIEAVEMVNPVQVIFAGIKIAFPEVAAFVICTVPNRTDCPRAPAKVTTPLVPARRVRFWLPEAVPSIYEVGAKKVILPPVDEVPPAVVSRVVFPERRVDPVRVILFEVFVSVAPNWIP